MVPELGLDVVLSLAGLAAAVVSVPVGVWAGGDRPTAAGGARPATLPRDGGVVGEQLVVGDIPRQPPSFQPRADLYARLSEAPGVAVVTALTGSRGIGKTHLAAAFARGCIAEGWPVVAWLVAEDTAQVLDGLDRLARALGLARAGDDSVAAARMARRWLETRAGRRCLLILDNVPDAAVVRPWLPAVGAARIIVTTTSQSCADLGTEVPVDVFTPQEAVAYLRDRTDLADDAGARALAEEVGCLPLALSQIAAVARAEHLSYQRALGRVRSVPLSDLLGPSTADGYPRGAAQSVLLAVESAAAAGSVARALASVLAVLSPAGTRRDLLEAYCALEENNGAISVADVDQALGRLAEASVLTFTLDGDAVLMHRFTQRVIRDSDRKAGELENSLLLAARIVGERMPRVGASPWHDRELLKELIADVDMLWSLRPEEDPGTSPGAAAPEILRLRGRSLYCLWTIGESNIVREHGPGVVADHVQLFGDDSEETMEALSGLALAYGGLGMHDEAIEMHQRLLSWYTANRGTDEASITRYRNLLGNNYFESARDFGEPDRLQASVALHEDNLRQREQAFGADHGHTLQSGLNLSRSYRCAGRVADAVSVADQMLQRSVRAFGASHSNSRWARQTLAEAQAADGRTAEAMALIEESLAGLDLGEEKSWALRATRADILCRAGLPDQAIGELTELVAAYRGILGDNAPSTRRALQRLAAACRQAGRTADAISAYDKAYAACSQTIGRDNPLTARIARELAELREEQDRSQARRMRYLPRLLPK